MSSAHEDEVSASSPDEPIFEPIRTRKTRESVDYQFDSSDHADLARIASVLSGAQSRQPTQTGQGLQRQDTVAGMALESPEFDPNHKSFNFFLWVRSKYRFVSRLLMSNNVDLLTSSAPGRISSGHGK